MDNAFSLMRPPGHHALSTRAMGYCIFNNVAVAAMYALREHNLERVLILDIDAHHGNGTEEIFYGSREVLFVSFHQQPWFPGTGDWFRNGAEAGLGYNYNVALPQWSGDDAYLQVIEELVTPLAERYEPQLVLVSAGFDAHWMDHSSVLGLSVQGYHDLISQHPRSGCAILRWASRSPVGGGLQPAVPLCLCGGGPPGAAARAGRWPIRWALARCQRWRGWTAFWPI